ncbi:hypothetical protein SLW70_16505 [Flavobacterium sp. NG2]|uniref:hypothetical protein n=1 Tax=Flavobacterium sp. NG2 TaxID=3097547 RepID=UPI002A83BA43|nr:hypothetical protein [Flavobacterium sp. NG2]WPR71516.1 hypothetical protein SLW70_16505 [Flavobacterium sp. NG2]
MRLIAKLFLFLFIAFLLTPTVVTLIEKKCDVSMFYKFSEEEHSHSKEVKVYACNQLLNSDFLVIKIEKSNLIQSENLSKHDNVSSKIFSPPPDIA